MTITNAHEAMQNGKKVTHPNIEDVEYLHIMLGSAIIDHSANDKHKYFELLKTNPIFKDGWELTDIKKV